MDDPPLSSTQQIEAMANEPWSEEAELELRAIEDALTAPTGVSSTVLPGAWATDFPSASPANATPLSLSQQIEAMQSLPWSEEEERAVRQVEESAYGVARQTSVVSISDSSPTPSPPELRLTRPRRTRSVVAMKFLDLEAEQSGSDTTSGSEADDPSGEGAIHQQFIAPNDLATQPSREERDSVFRLGLLSQNMADGPQFQDAPVRRGQFGGVAVLRMTHRTTSQSSVNSLDEEGPRDRYQIGSFVVDDDDPIAYDSGCSSEGSQAVVEEAEAEAEADAEEEEDEEEEEEEEEEVEEEEVDYLAVTT
ncbi:hypothetical protein EV121DRAFT_288275 [Schizophyllum commune]